MFNVSNGSIRLSVRSFVEFIFRSGDIDNRIGQGPDYEAMQAGSRLHRKIQKQMGKGYTPEIPLKTVIEREGYSIVIEGRADGIFCKDNEVIVDEIKSMYAQVASLKEPVYVHKAQALCYAYIYSTQNNLKEISVQLTYANLETEEILRFKENLSFKELKKWFEDAALELAKWTDFYMDSRRLRNQSIKAVEFPYEYREGQRDLVVAAYRTMKQHKRLFIQAPTGVGKTISTVFPAVKAVGEELADKVFYLTAKTITRTAAKEAFAVMRKQELRFRTEIITSKEKICEYNLGCNPVECPFAEGHFDRVNAAVYDLVNNEFDIDRNLILQYASKHKVCPFEMSLDVSYWCDGIICDYNYVFDPNARLKRYFGDDNGGDYIFLVDEAHNLVERGREMYSAAIYKKDFLKFKNTMKKLDNRVYREAEKVNKALLEVKRQAEGDFVVLDNVQDVELALMRLYDEMIRFNDERHNYDEKDLFLEMFFKVRDYLYVSELVDENYVTYARILEDGDLMLKEFCVNPANNINKCVEKGISSVFFSATLLPIKYYKSLLSTDEQDYAIYAKSVFDPQKSCILIGCDVTTRYAMRNERQYRRVYEYINKITRAQNGNYMVFFPSYSYMEEVAKYHNDTDFELISQRQDMDEAAKEEFLGAFNDSHKQKSMAGFCVMGGVFSEGIDLKEESLIGSVIVGTGIPQIGVERRILMENFDKDGMGFAYAYQYPGLNKVLQAAGRVIRTENDRGVIVLLDDRFLSKDYDGMFPREWEDAQVVNIENISQRLGEFWNK